MEDKTPAEPLTKTDIAELIQGITALRGDITRLAVAGVKTEEAVRQVKEDLTISLKSEISRVMNHIDGFASQALSYQNHDILRGGKIMEHETKIVNHESRLVLLETHK